MKDIPFGDEPSECRQKRNSQTEPDEYFQEWAQVVLGNDSASHGEEDRKAIN